MSDELFLSDLTETMEDFQHADRDQRIAGALSGGVFILPILIQSSAPSRDGRARCSSLARQH